MNDTDDEPTAIMAVGSDVPAAVLGYYRCVVATRDHQPGQYVRVIRIEPDGAVHYQRRDRGWIYDRDGFLAHFDYAPEGEQAVNDELLALMTEISDVSQDVADLHASLSSVIVHVGGQGQEAAGMEGLTAIVPITDRTPAGYKIALARVRGLAQVKQELLKEKQKEFQAIMAEKMAVATAMLAPLQEMVDRIQEGIWTVNLYLGKDEQIVVLRDGDRAPAGTPITLRQMVLAMDQECAVAAEDGGIDARSIADFDRWIVERPEHLDQVLPETKGVVVLVPRWDAKTYDDPWVTRQVAAANTQSYFLIRNGDWLCRIATDFIVGKTLMPRRDEFLELFYEERTDWKTLTRERVAVEPGTRAYMEAEKRADARAKHYFRIGLILQGLIDRTTVFHPLPVGIQVTKAESYDRGWIQLIADAELALGDGHERYKDWVTRINSTLDAGMRIIGNFGGWNFDHESFGGLADKYDRHPRITPSGAERPDSNTLHTLEGKRDGGYYFLYKRDRDIWSFDEGYHPARQRASCVVKTDDRFILAYDAATLDEMEYYLRSRQDRQAYVHMFPVLKAAIRMKRQEAEQEAPFLLLLAGQIVERYGVDFETATAAVPDLVEWYKFKNRTHRRLVGDDDGKALRMIVDEFAVRQRESQNRIVRRNRGEFAGVCNLLMAAYPDLLLIAHKAGPEYVALVPHNDDPVYVREVILTSRGAREVKSWRIVDNRFKRWHVLYTSERWEGWHINASRSEHATDDEIEMMVDVARVRSEKAFRQRVVKGWTKPDENYRFLAAAFDRDANVIHIYVLLRDGLIPTERLLSTPPRACDVVVDTFTWHRTTGMVAALGGCERESVEWPKTGRPWDAHQYRRHSAYSRAMRDRAEMVLAVDEESVSYVEDLRIRYSAAQIEHARFSSVLWQALNSLKVAWLAREEQRRFAAFLVEYRDPDLWEGHRKTLPELKFPYRQNDAVIASVVSHLVERGVNLDGMTFGDALLRYQAREGSISQDEAEQLAKIMPTDLDELVIRTGDSKQ